MTSETKIVKKLVEALRRTASTFEASILEFEGYSAAENDPVLREAEEAITEAQAWLEREGKCGEGVDQWKLAEWLHDFEAEVDAHGVYLRPWETQPQNIKKAYYGIAAECLEATTTSQQEARRE